MRDVMVRLAEPGSRFVMVRVKTHPLELDVARSDARDNLNRLFSIQRLSGQAGFDLTDELVDRVTAFAKSGSCPDCGRQDAICRRPDPMFCQIAEIMES